MTCDNATDPSALAHPALAAESKRAEFRANVIETFLLYLFTYEMTIERVRLLLEKVESQSLRDFPDLRQAGWRWDASRDLLERLQRIEDSVLEKAARKVASQEARRLGSSQSPDPVASNPPTTLNEVLQGEEATP